MKHTTTNQFSNWFDFHHRIPVSSSFLRTMKRRMVFVISTLVLPFLMTTMISQSSSSLMAHTWLQHSQLYNHHHSCRIKAIPRGIILQSPQTQKHIIQCQTTTMTTRTTTIKKKKKMMTFTRI